MPACSIRSSTGILQTVGTQPTRIVMGTTLLALLIHLDGSGAVTFLVTIPAMLPLYERLGMDRRILACAASMAAGVNFLPWTGPMIRASASLQIAGPGDLQSADAGPGVGLVFIFAAAWWLGRARSGGSGSTRARTLALCRPATLTRSREGACAGRRISGSTSC